MAQVNVPGVGVLQFPDGMSDADMAAAIQKNFPQIHQQPGLVDQGLDFGKQMLQSGGRQIMTAATAIPGMFADATASGYNLLHGRNAPTLQQTAAGQQGDYPFPVLPSQDFKNRLAPVLGTRPDGGAGIAEDVGSAVIGAKLPIPGAPAAAPAAAAAPSATRAQQVATLAQEGVRLDSSQALGGKLPLVLKNYANDGAFGDAQAFRDAQAGEFTNAAMRQMGVNATEATPAAMNAGKQALRQNYNAIAARTNLQIDSGLNSTIGAIRYAAQRALTPDNAQVIENQLQDIEAMAQANSGRISGSGYQRLQEALGNVAKDGGKSPFVTQIRQALTDALGRQASPADTQLLAQTNQRYGAMKVIERAVNDKNQVVPSLLYNAMDTVKGSNLSVYGNGSNTRLMDLAQAGRSVLGTNTANSGTPERLAGLTAITTAGGAITALATGHVETAEALLAAATAAGFSQSAAKALVYSPAGRQWLQRWAAARAATWNGLSTVRPTSGPAAMNGVAAGLSSANSAPPNPQSPPQE